MELQKVADGYIKASEIQTTGPKGLKYGFKWYQSSILADPWCPQTNFSQNYGIGLPKLWLSADNGVSESGGRVY